MGIFGVILTVLAPMLAATGQPLSSSILVVGAAVGIGVFLLLRHFMRL